MPLVNIRYKHNVEQKVLKGILPDLCQTVAEQLCCDGPDERIMITPQMVKVRFDQASELDTNMPDLMIEIEARHFPERQKSLNSFGEQLTTALAPHIPNDIQLSVWFKLCHADWCATIPKICRTNTQPKDPTKSSLQNRCRPL